MTYEPDLAYELQTSAEYLYIAAQALEQSNMPATAAMLRSQAERNQKALSGPHPPR